MLEGCGFEVINIGIDVTCDKFVEAVKENKADILCMSALLTTTMTYMQDVIRALEEAGDPRSGESDDRRSTRESGICR